MSLSIKKVKIASSDEWDEHWEMCEYATYFQSREWNELWEEYTKGVNKAEAYLIEFSDMSSAVLPYVFIKCYKGLEKQHLMSPAGTSGGWVSKEILTPSHQKLLLRFLKGKSIQWRFNPYCGISIDEIKFGHSKDDVTNVLPLKNDFSIIFKEWSKGHKSAAKKAAREGVTIHLATEIEEWKNYYSIYQKSIERWGDKATSSYSWKMFSSLFNRYSPNIKLWLACYRNNIVAGALCFYSKNHVVYWHGAADDEFFNLRPVHFLLQVAIEDACLNNYQWFDFNPSGGHEGVKKFKRGFATIEKESPVIRNYDPLSKNIRRMHGLINRIKKNIHA